MSTTIRDIQTNRFKEFPNFTKLSIDSKQEYESYIVDFPPLADIQFLALMGYWNQLEGVPVAVLNGNLVVQYWIPGDEKNSGLCLLGTNKVDESICTIFDYLRERGEEVRLVNVPERVITHINYPELFISAENRDVHEYIVPVAHFYPLKNIKGIRRAKIDRSLKKYGEDNVIVRSIDLHDAENRHALLSLARRWWGKNFNDFGRVEREAMTFCVENAELLNVENACLFVGGKLRGFCLYQLSHDKRYAIISHVKATHSSFLGYDLMTYEFAKWFASQGVDHVNLNTDEGRLALRMFMLTLGPTNFFRKYTIVPA